MHSHDDDVHLSWKSIFTLLLYHKISSPLSPSQVWLGVGKLNSLTLQPATTQLLKNIEMQTHCPKFVGGSLTGPPCRGGIVWLGWGDFWFWWRRWGQMNCETCGVLWATRGFQKQHICPGMCCACMLPCLDHEDSRNFVNAMKNSSKPLLVVIPRSTN